jgi:hypothetical protein
MWHKQALQARRGEQVTAGLSSSRRLLKQAEANSEFLRALIPGACRQRGPSEIGLPDSTYCIGLPEDIVLSEQAPLRQEKVL